MRHIRFLFHCGYWGGSLQKRDGCFFAYILSTPIIVGAGTRSKNTLYDGAETIHIESVSS